MEELRPTDAPLFLSDVQAICITETTLKEPSKLVRTDQKNPIYNKVANDAEVQFFFVDATVICSF